MKVFLWGYFPECSCQISLQNRGQPGVTLEKNWDREEATTWKGKDAITLNNWSVLPKLAHSSLQEKQHLGGAHENNGGGGRAPGYSCGHLIAVTPLS